MLDRNVGTFVGQVLGLGFGFKGLGFRVESSEKWLTDCFSVLHVEIHSFSTGNTITGGSLGNPRARSAHSAAAELGSADRRTA